MMDRTNTDISLDEDYRLRAERFLRGVVDDSGGDWYADDRYLDVEYIATLIFDVEYMATLIRNMARGERTSSKEQE